MAAVPQSSRIERQITNLIRHAIDPDLVEARRLPGFGNPDLASSYAKVAVFVDGCYWHGCPDHGGGRHAASQQARDAQVNAKLAKAGWAVLRVWEHEEHLAPFIESASATITKRAKERRAEVLEHIARHPTGEWCTTCEMWPHAPASDRDGRCSRCTLAVVDHETAADDLKLFGPPTEDDLPPAADVTEEH